MTNEELKVLIRYHASRARDLADIEAGSINKSVPALLNALNHLGAISATLLELMAEEER